MNPPRPLQVGGTVPLTHLYLRRAADDELPAALWRGELCYVLAPRQMGKSSLRLRAMEALKQRGVRVAFVDLTTLGGQGADARAWYFSLLDNLRRQLGLVDPSAFWAGRSQGTIEDERRTPFNVGRAVVLEDFALEQLGALREAGLPVEAAEGGEAVAVAELVQRLFFGKGRVREVSLAYAEKHFERKSKGERVDPMLWLYGRLLRKEEVAVRAGDPVQGRWG